MGRAVPLNVLLIGAARSPCFVFFFLPRLRDPIGGGFLNNYISSPAKRYEKGKGRITFDDVAGMENAKRELQEIVEFLEGPGEVHPARGPGAQGRAARRPAGHRQDAAGQGRRRRGERAVLLHQRVSEFIQMFVGVGASRVRDMFKTAKENAPCVMFIDEIDAVGRMRGAGRRRRVRRARADAQPDPQRDGRVPADRDGHRDGRDQPAGRARLGPVAAGPVRPAHHRRPADVAGPAGDPQGPHPEQAAGRRRGPGADRPEHDRHERGRPAEPVQRGGAAGDPRRARTRSSRSTSTGPPTASGSGRARGDVLTTRRSGGPRTTRPGTPCARGWSRRPTSSTGCRSSPAGGPAGVTMFQPDEDRVDHVAERTDRPAGDDAWAGGRPTGWCSASRCPGPIERPEAGDADRPA